jgi:hypothetical protein
VVVVRVVEVGRVVDDPPRGDHVARRIDRHVGPFAERDLVAPDLGARRSGELHDVEDGEVGLCAEGDDIAGPGRDGVRRPVAAVVPPDLVSVRPAQSNRDEVALAHRDDVVRDRDHPLCTALAIQSGGTPDSVDESFPGARRCRRDGKSEQKSSRLHTRLRRCRTRQWCPESN